MFENRIEYISLEANLPEDKNSSSFNNVVILIQIFLVNFT